MAKGQTKPTKQIIYYPKGSPESMQYRQTRFEIFFEPGIRIRLTQYGEGELTPAQANQVVKWVSNMLRDMAAQDDVHRQ
jgi:hypothetical protein